MKWTRIEDSLFLIKGGLVYYTMLGAALFLIGSLLFTANWADAAKRDRISFASNRGGNFDIYVRDIKGERSRNLTNHPTDEFGPWAGIGLPLHTWSPDGRFLAYVSGRDGVFKIYVMDTQTQENWRLTHRPEKELAPAWSPDGRWIAFVSHDNEGDSEIYKMEVKSAHLVQLTDFGGNEHPAWSPDGKQIAFVSLSHKRGGKRDGLYIMDADGDRLRRVPNANRGLIGKGCAWSPDGKQITFSVYIPNTRREHLCVIDVDGRNFRQLTRGGPIPILGNKAPAFPLLPRPPLPQIGSPVWYPDGKWIAYVYSETILWQTTDIYVIDAAGNERGKPIVTGARQNLSPAWVPEGFLSVSPSIERQTTLWGRLKEKMVGSYVKH